MNKQLLESGLLVLECAGLFHFLMKLVAMPLFQKKNKKKSMCWVLFDMLVAVQLFPYHDLLFFF